jgi:hypothetical protein
VFSLSSDSDQPKKRRKGKASKPKRQKTAATGSRQQRASKQRSKSPSNEGVRVAQRLLEGVKEGEEDSAAQREKVEKELQEVQNKEQAILQRLPSLQVTERVLAELELRQLAQRRQALQQWQAILTALTGDGGAPTPPIAVASSLHKRPRRATVKALKYAESSAEESEDALQATEGPSNRNKRARRGRTRDTDETGNADVILIANGVADSNQQATVPVPVPVPDESKLPTRKRGRNPKIPPLSERLKAVPEPAAPAPSNTVASKTAPTQPTTAAEPDTQPQDVQPPAQSSTAVQPASGYEGLLAVAADNMQQRAAEGEAQQPGGGRRRARPTIKPRVQSTQKEAGVF